MGLHHRPHRVGRAHHDQVQAIQQQGLIADAAQQIGGTVGISLAEILKVVQVQHQTLGPLRLCVDQQVPQHPWAIKDERTRRCRYAFGLGAANPKSKR